MLQVSSGSREHTRTGGHRVYIHLLCSQGLCGLTPESRICSYVTTDLIITPLSPPSSLTISTITLLLLLIHIIPGLIYSPARDGGTNDSIYILRYCGGSALMAITSLTCSRHMMANTRDEQRYFVCCMRALDDLYQCLIPPFFSILLLLEILTRLHQFRCLTDFFICCC